MSLLILFFIISTAAVVVADAGVTTTTNTNTTPTIGGSGVLGCERLKHRNAVTGNDDTLQKPPSREFWIQLRDAYVSAVGENESTIDWPLSRKTTTTKEPASNSATEHLSGFMIPYEVKITPGKGRSVHTKQFVPKGTPVWSPKYTAYFFGNRNQEQFENFLTKLTWEQSCDVLQWCYAADYDAADYEEEEESGDYDYDDYKLVGCDLDEAAMINHGASISGEANIVQDKEKNAIVAMKDIHAGDELLQDYNDFDEDLEWFDNLASKAWGVDTWSQQTDAAGVDDDAWSQAGAATVRTTVEL